MLLHRYRAILRRHRRVSSICVARSRVGVQPSSSLDFAMSPTNRRESPGRRDPTLLGTGPAMRAVSANTVVCCSQRRCQG